MNEFCHEDSYKYCSSCIAYKAHRYLANGEYIVRKQKFMTLQVLCLPHIDFDPIGRKIKYAIFPTSISNFVEH